MFVFGCRICEMSHFCIEDKLWNVIKRAIEGIFMMYKGHKMCVCVIKAY